MAEEEDVMENLPRDEAINGLNSINNNHGKDDDDDDEFNRLLQEGQPELTNDEEMAAQAAAESQFDTLFETLMILIVILATMIIWRGQ